MYVRAQWLENNNEGYGATANKMPTQFPYNYQTKSPNMVFDLTYTFSPTLLNEMTLGTSEFDEFTPYNASDLPKVQKSASGYDYPGLYSGNNPLNLFPAVSFGGTNAVQFGWDSRFPFYDITKQYSITDSVTKILGAHNLKFGADLKTDHYLQAHGSTGTPEGSFTFNSSSNMAADSYNGFANALLGNFQNYAEPNTRSDYNPRIYVVEGYGQDQWKVTPKLTLDYGTRFAWVKPPTLETGGNFVPDLYVAANAPAMYRPCKSGNLTGVCDPTNGSFTPNSTLSGRISFLLQLQIRRNWPTAPSRQRTTLGIQGAWCMAQDCSLRLASVLPMTRLATARRRSAVASASSSIRRRRLGRKAT